VLALGALSAFRWIERNVRTEAYAQVVVCFAAESRAPPERRGGAGEGTWLRGVGMTHHYRRGNAVMEYA
jgi:hypothetical protein